LSGGIGLENLTQLQEFKTSPAATYCYAVDVNSKFEIAPAKKNKELLEKFKQLL
jgi:phosphoribosylanthranilate isomerase